MAKQSRLRLSKKQINELIRLKLSGVTVGQLAKDFNMSTSMVYYWLSAGKKRPKRVVKERVESNNDTPALLELVLSAQISADKKLSVLKILLG